MIEKLATTYRCEFCNKLYLQKKSCARHEGLCSKNPINDRPCLNCAHMSKKEIEVSHDTPYGSQYSYPELLFCSKLSKCVYPPQVEVKGNAFDIEEYPNEPMPKECEHHISNVLYHLKKL